MTAGKTGKRLALAYLAFLGFFWMIPILWLVLNSFKPNAQFLVSFAGLTGPLDYVSRLWPETFTLRNYTESFLGGAGTNTAAQPAAHGDQQRGGGLFPHRPGGACDLPGCLRL